MTPPPSAIAGEPQITRHAIRRAIARPYRVTLPMVFLVSLVPLYLVIANLAQTSAPHAPAVALDRLVPLVPAWALVYGALYAFLIVLPVIVVQQEDLIRRTVWAYILVWSTSYVVFLVYPTVAPRPSLVYGEGFAVWGLRFLYDADPPYNCFPSIHVAHSFVSAFACYQVHRALGLVTLGAASLVAMSTLFTKQHYVADLVGGVVLACIAHALFTRGYSRARIPGSDRRLAPALALCVAGVIALGMAGYWVAYRVTG